MAEKIIKVNGRKYKVLEILEDITQSERVKRAQAKYGPWGRTPLDIDLEEVKRLRLEQGLSYPKIAQRMCCDTMTIYNRLKDLGLAYGDAREWKKNKKRYPHRPGNLRSWTDNKEG